MDNHQGHRTMGQTFVGVLGLSKKTWKNKCLTFDWCFIPTSHWQSLAQTSKCMSSKWSQFISMIFSSSSSHDEQHSGLALQSFSWWLKTIGMHCDIHSMYPLLVPISEGGRDAAMLRVWLWPQLGCAQWAPVNGHLLKSAASVLWATEPLRSNQRTKTIAKFDQCMVVKLAWLSLSCI